MVFKTAAALLGMALVTLLVPTRTNANEPLIFTTGNGPLQLTLLGHGSLMLEYNSKVIYVDPFSQVAKYENLPKASQIWITHDHYDHLDLAANNAIKSATTRYVANARSASKLQGDVTTLKNGDKVTIDGIQLEAVPAYNQVRERAPGQKYHPKHDGNGYVITFGQFRLYIGGDTEAIPEMASLNDIDVALLPVMLPYTMSPEEAAKAALSFMPKMLLPYHANKSDAQKVAAQLAGTEIEVKIALP